MKLGVLQFFGWPDRKVPLESIYASALERIEIMDQTGYDCVWLAEHHFSGYSVCPSVHMMGMLAAARTRRLRIGTAVSLASFYHPLRLAEEVAMLDVLSGGRVNWGAGRGFDRVEFETFGVPAEESVTRFREAVEIVLRAWSEERITYQSKLHNFKGVEVLPKPLQKPHPPVWMASGSESAIEWAAAKGFSILLGPHDSSQEIGARRKYYEAKLQAAGHSMAGREIPTARLLVVAPSAAKAEEIARRGAAWLVGSYLGPQHNAVLQRPRLFGGNEPIEHYARNVIIHGTPASVTEQFLALKETAGLDYIMCAPLSRETFTLFTDKVLPRLVG
jgi:alkanesulfonate monooxygenase SsuD/methylene tetrahydromethanopterin reductase-like flavin-dependent oxidoreductase (luciferase family)